MLNVRQCLFAVSPLKKHVFYSSTFRNSKKQVQKSGGPKKNVPVRRGMMFGHNPGVQAQMTALNFSEQELKDPNVLEDFEHEFWNVDKIQANVDREKYIEEQLHGIYQVTRKQFKEKPSPSMLLWDEKREIKSLHAQDPHSWTIMKLAFSYPATPSIIKKVIKTNVKLRTHAEIEKHDKRVRKNWEALSKGELDIANEELKKHLLSFINRSKVQSYTKEISTKMANSNITDPLKNVLKDGGVFGNIYESYKQLKQSEIKTDDIVKENLDESSVELGLKMLHHPPENNTFIIPRSVQNVTLRTEDHVPLEKMKRRVWQDVERGETLGDDEMNFVKDRVLSNAEKSTYHLLQDPIGNTRPADFRKKFVTNEKSESFNNGEIRTVKEMDLPVQKSSCNEMVNHDDSSTIEEKTAFKFVDISKMQYTQDQEDKELLARLTTAKLERSAVDSQNMVKAVKDYVSRSSESFSLQITIPKDLWKKGALYRVKDRFYTDDGEFLYRVPGLSKE